MVNQIWLMLYGMTADDCIECIVYVKYISEIMNLFRASACIHADFRGSLPQTDFVEHIKVTDVFAADHRIAERADFKNITKCGDIVGETMP